MDERLFRTLVTTPGISGREDRIRDVVKKELEPLVDEVRTDRLGNLVGIRTGTRPKVMLCAHMDSIGFVVSHIEDAGFLRIQPVGGFDTRTLVNQQVLVQTRAKDYIGLLSPATKPIHVLDEDEAKKIPKMNDFIVDLMIPADEVKEAVSIGDPVTYYREPVVTDRAVTAPYLDDRLGVYVLLSALKKARRDGSEVHAVVSVQEEVGLRGAKTSAFEIDPDLGIALDVTLAVDIPGVDQAQQGTTLGDGSAIGIMNSMSISDPRLVDRFKDLANERNIKHQFDILPFGGTDAGAIQITKAGVPAITMSVPVRYVHTVNEMALVDDIEATVDLLAGFLDVAGDLDLGR
jgi:tetrahedral aminopeptidase